MSQHVANWRVYTTERCTSFNKYGAFPVGGTAVCQGTKFKFINETAGPNVIHRPHSEEEMAL